MEGICFYEIFDPAIGVLNCTEDVDILIQKTSLKLLHECIESNTLEDIMMNKQKMQFQMKVSIENKIYLL